MFLPKTNYTAVKFIKLVTYVIQISIYPVKNKRNIELKKLLGFFCSSVYINNEFVVNRVIALISVNILRFVISKVAELASVGRFLN